MTQHKGSKLNHLNQLLPEGLIADASWFERHGYARSLRHYYVSTNWLESLAPGVFRRPRGPLHWQQVVVSLQTLLEQPVSVGGRTALGLQGYTHYLPHTEKKLHLYWETNAPFWLSKLPLEQSFVNHNRLRLLPAAGFSPPQLDGTAQKTDLATGLRVFPQGAWNWPMVISTPERAYLELLDELPGKESFHIADVTMESMATLSPRRLQRLLEQCKSIKVNRLFFFFADRHQHQWRARLDLTRINLGKGKRTIAENGRLDPAYQITVPTSFLDGTKDDV